MRRKTGSKIGWLGWSDSLIAEATGCHWWSTESGEGWQDLLFYVHSSPTVSLSHSMYSYSIFVGHIWDEQWKMINMLKTSIDTAPPPPATLPFTHPKRPKCQNLTRKWFVQKVRESWICKLMSVPTLMMHSSLSSRAMQWNTGSCRLFFQQRTLAPSSLALKSVQIFVSKTLSICFHALDIHQLRVVIDISSVHILHQLLHGHKLLLDSFPPIIFSFALFFDPIAQIIAHCHWEAFDRQVLVLLVVLEIVQENRAKGVHFQSLALFRCWKVLWITFLAVPYCWMRQEETKAFSHIPCLVAFLDESGHEFLRALLLEMSKVARVILGTHFHHRSGLIENFGDWFLFEVPKTEVLLTNFFMFYQEIHVYLLSSMGFCFFAKCWFLRSFLCPKEWGILPNEHFADVDPSLLIEVILGSFLGQAVRENRVAHQLSGGVLQDADLSAAFQLPLHLFLGRKEGPQQAPAAVKPTRPRATPKHFSLHMLDHMLGTGLSKRNVMAYHIICKVLCLILHHFQQVVTFVFAHLWQGMLPQGCLRRTCAIFLHWSHSAIASISISILITAFLWKFWRLLCPRSLFGFLWSDGASEGVLADFGRGLLQGAFYAKTQVSAVFSIALLHHGIAKAQRRGRDRHLEELQGLGLRHTAAAFRGLGAAEVAAVVAAAVAFLAEVGDAPISTCTFAPILTVAFGSKFFTWVFTVAVGAYGHQQIEAAPIPLLTVSGKGAILWALAGHWLPPLLRGTKFCTWILSPQRGFRLKHGFCFWGASHACNMVHQGQQHQNEEHCHSRTQIEESLAQTSEEFEIAFAWSGCKKKHTLSSLDCSSQSDCDHTSNSANRVLSRQQNHGDKKLPTKKHATPCIGDICRFNLGNTKLGAPTGRTSSASCCRFSSPVSFVQRRKCNAKKMTKQI